MLRTARAAIRARFIRALEEVAHQERSELLEALRQQQEQLESALRREAERTIEEIRWGELRDRRDLFAAAERQAAYTSSEFATEHMPTVPTFSHPHRTLDYALSLAPNTGMALEFGVYSGQTLNIIATARHGKQVFGFDSFEGLPTDWRTRFPAGTFNTDTLPEVPGAELVVGWFDDTLSGFLAEHPDDVGFLHLDADLYSSTRTVLDQVGPRLRKGSIVVFDEYFNFPGWQEHEYRAWQEHTELTGMQYVYEGYTVDNEQVIVRITDVGNPEAIAR